MIFRLKINSAGQNYLQFIYFMILRFWNSKDF
jgi:hypothetical protein